MQNVIKRTLGNIIYSYVLNHKTEIDYQDIPVYSFSSADIKIITLSTNNIVQTPVGYFRICRRWRRKKEYDRETYRIYQMLIGGGQIIDNQLNVFNLHEKAKYSRINPLLIYDTFSANRAVASYKVAQLLGKETLLTKCEMAWLKIDDNEPFLGTMSSIANGVGFWNYIKTKSIKDHFTPSLLRDLSNLEILDTICHEPDHGANNYMLVVDETEKITHICAFDNDNPKDFFISTDCKHSLTTETKSMITKNGCFNRKYADKDIVGKLLSLNRKTVFKELNPYLNCLQLHFCWLRVRSLQKSIEKSLDIDKLCLLSHSEWTQQMVDDEISGKNGRTYSYVLIDWKDYHINASKKNKKQ